jgi:hypothetical protein
MRGDQVDWAGVPFLALFHHDASFVRQPGIFAFVHREGEHRTLLFVGHGDNLASDVESHLLRGEALRLGWNELNVCTRASARVDRLVLTAHIVKRCLPLLNLLSDDQDQRSPACTIKRRRRA